jgi:hypothetical protein
MGEPSGGQVRTEPRGAARALASSEFLSDQESMGSALDIPDLLAQLPALEDEIEAGERRLRECVRLLRAHRATWREIGDALQVSRQAAWERFRTS